MASGELWFVLGIRLKELTCCVDLLPIGSRFIHPCALNHPQTQLITQHVALIFGADATVWLFGSQLDDEQVAGDVDLFIDTPQRNGLRQIVQAKAALTSALGRPVDIVLRAPGRDPGPIGQIAEQTGTRLQ